MKKDPIVSSYRQQRSAMRPIWRPISGKEKWKARGVEGKRGGGGPGSAASDRKQIKKDPILIFICAHIGSLPYLCSHRLFSENTDVSTTELNRKRRRRRVELPMDKKKQHSAQEAGINANFLYYYFIQMRRSQSGAYSGLIIVLQSVGESKQNPPPELS